MNSVFAVSSRPTAVHLHAGPPPSRTTSRRVRVRPQPGEIGSASFRRCVGVHRPRSSPQGAAEESPATQGSETVQYDDIDVVRPPLGADTTTTSGSGAADTLSSLSALLGESDPVALEAKEEAEAERRMAEREAAADARTARAEGFKSVVMATMRQQQLQMAFAHVPLLPTLKSPLGNGPADTAEVQFFDLPAAGTAPNGELSQSGSAAEERLPGEFTIPVVPYPYAAMPGARVGLSLYEPKWLTLFSKLLAGGPDSTDPPGVLTGATSATRIDVTRIPACQAYESGDPTGGTGSIEGGPNFVPGIGRMDETGFVGTNVFGAVYITVAPGAGAEGASGDGQRLAAVGTMMNTVAHDVVGGGRLLQVYAQGERRFRILRVRQAEPYIVVDAVFLDDDEEEAAAAEAASVAATTTTEATDACKEAVRTFEELLGRLRERDSEFVQAVGLAEVKRTDLDDALGQAGVFGVANALLYSKPAQALAVLASVSPTERAARVKEACDSTNTALALGATPHNKARLQTASSFAAVFFAGVAISVIKNAVLAAMASGGP